VRRSLIALAAGALFVACASASPPPGGPEDHEPPRLVKVTPDSGALNVRDRDASFYFNETINDRGTGAAEIDNHFLVSPSDGLPHIGYHRSRIDVRPRHGFRDNTAYSITLLPGLTDLRNNPMKSSRTIVFSTGPAIPPYEITGIVFDWLGERPAPRAFIEALTPDSVAYLAQADSLGRFVVGPLPLGRYLVRGIIDANGNRDLDRNEAYDSATVVVPQPKPLELLAIPRDTLPVRIQTVAVLDSVSLRVTFDRPLDPGATFSPANFRLVGADSTPIAITAVLTPSQETAAAKARQQATADSSRRADSLAGKPRAPVAAPAPAPPARTAAAASPKPSIPAPISTLLLKLGSPLAPSTTYRLAATGLRALSGRTQPSERTFSTPKPPPPKPAADSTARVPARPPADSARRVPAPTAPRPTTPPVAATPPARR
jgi:hypothetical protein